jgi:hypothetical protein
VGYETKIYVGTIADWAPPTKVGNYFQVFGMLDCSVIGCDLISDEVKAAGIPCYLYGSDGNTEITEDCYGERCKAVPIASVIEVLKALLKREKYSRARWAYDMLKSMGTKRKDHHGMTATHCILFGH